MKILALDYGQKRIGVAVGDTTFNIAFARNYIPHTPKIFQNIAELCEQEGIQKIIIGKPLMLSGEASNSTKKVEQFAQNLSEKISISIEFIDERFSTNIAQNRLNFGSAKQSKKKELIDSSSAQVILEDYFKRQY